MADKTQQLTAPEGLVSQADALLKLLGGTKTTTSPGDTGALQSTLGQLQGTDYEAMLKAIFQQAGGQIPGLQQALGNAIGARSGGNSAVQAALSKLLAQTSTGAMDQVAKLQAQNMATQANVGQSIAAATKGTTTKAGTDVGGGLANAAKLVALLQGAKTLGADKWLKDLTGTSASTGAAEQVVTAPAFGADQTTGGGVTAAGTPLLTFPGYETGAAEQPSYQTPQLDFTQAGFTPVAGDAYMPAYEPQAFVPGDAYMPAYEPQPVDTFELDWQAATDYADGGIVRGRGNSTAATEPSDTPEAETAEEEGEARANARYDPGFTANNFLDTFRQLLGANDNVGKAKGYADGGTVRAGGSRRSANPTVDITTPEAAMARLAADELRGQFAPQAQALSSPVATASGSDMANAITSSGRLSSGGNDSMTAGLNATTGGMSPQAFGNAVGKAGAVSNISGILGGPTLGQAGGVLGLAGNLANAQTTEQALGAVGKFGANMAVPGLGNVIGFAQNPSQVNALNFAASLNPIGALWGGVSALTGMPSAGQVAFGSPQSVNPATGDVTEATTGLLGAGGTFGGNPAMSSPVSGWGDMTTTDLGSLDSSTTDTSTDTGGLSTNSDTGGLSDSPGNGDGSADGGPIDGAGTGISDSNKANLSDGEFVMSADVVEALGEDFFNQLQAAFHTPAAQQRARA